MDKHEASDRVLEIKDEICSLVREARELVIKFAGNGVYALDAYVFNQFDELCNKENPNNVDLNDVADEIHSEKKDARFNF